MAHIVDLPDVPTGEKKARKSIKDVLGDAEGRREDMKQHLLQEQQQQRDNAREGATAKRRLRIIATQKCKSDQECVEALQKIEAMTHDEALSTLDLYLAKADASFVDKIALQLRQGLGVIFDTIVRAEGQVSEKFQQDTVLHECLVKELGFAASFINNKTQIAICCATDTIGGYNDNRAMRKIATKEKGEVEVPTKENKNIEETMIKIS